MRVAKQWGRWCAAVLLVIIGCGEGAEPAPSCTDPTVHASESLCALDDATTRCEFLIPEKCLLPYPSSVFLIPDTTTATGFRVDYPRAAMPAKENGSTIDPAAWHTLDGFSPGPIIEVLFPQGVDLAVSHVTSITDIESSLDADNPIVLLDVASGARVPYFAELDAHASSAATQMLLIHPAVRLHEATRYVVAVRNLIDPTGARIAPQRAFAILRDGESTPVAAINARRAAFEDIFSILSRAGVTREDLLLAFGSACRAATSLRSLDTSRISRRSVPSPIACSRPCSTSCCSGVC